MTPSGIEPATFRFFSTTNFVSYGNFIILFKYSKLLVSYTGILIEGRPQIHDMLKSFIFSYSIHLSHVKEVFLMTSLSSQTCLAPGERIIEYSALLLYECHIASTTVARTVT